MQVEVWTNRGEENVTFTKGDTMAVYVRVNIPGYIRLLYHTADNQRVLLLNNYYVDEAHVNQRVRVPGVFECTEPFGAEVLQVIASSKENPQLNIKRQDGYDFVDEALPNLLTKARGMKRVDGDVISAEKRIVITTLSK